MHRKSLSKHREAFINKLHTCLSGAPNIQSLESVYSQPNINWTLSQTNVNIWVPGGEEVSGDSWEYIDLLNADYEGGKKAEVCMVEQECCC